MNQQNFSGSTFLTSLFLVCLSLFVVAPQPAFSAPLNLEKLGESVGHLRLTDMFGDQSIGGTGFLIHRKGLVATNFHVIESATGGEFEFDDGKVVQITGVVASAPEQDLAIVQLESVPSGIEPLRMNSRSPLKLGSIVWAIGYPQGLRTVSSGQVNAIRTTADFPPSFQEFLGEEKNNRWIQTNAVLAPGSSGGPLLDGLGNVVGVNSWIIQSQQMGFALHIQHLEQLYRKHLSDEPKPFDPGSSGGLDVLSQISPEVAAIISDIGEKQINDSQRVSIQQRLLTLAGRNSGTFTSLQSWFFAVMLTKNERDPNSQSYSDEHERLREALAGLMRYHMIEPGSEGVIEKIALRLALTTYPSTNYFMQRALYLAEDRQNKSLEAMALFAMLSNEVRSLVSFSKTHPSINALLARRRLVEMKFDQLQKNQASFKIDGQSAGQLLDHLRYEFDHLMPGAKALSVSGRAVTGRPMELEDFRGKVVVLDFFANWCPHCRNMYGYEREMVEKYKDQPFALLGYNTEDERTVQELVRNREITWPTWVNDPRENVTNRWRVSSFPTLFVIDADGYIRYQIGGNPGEDFLNTCVEKLLKEKERTSTARKDSTVR
ncbi:Hypothetical protein PBC10988_30420 [Planctomycetales bacterium 10988]|nr:Hypothetical protein PBC10988_30420 [Planctomycetales bacterium 10988]